MSFTDIQKPTNPVTSLINMELIRVLMIRSVYHLLDEPVNKNMSTFTSTMMASSSSC